MKNIPDKNIDGVEIEVSIVPRGNYKIRPQHKMDPKYIILHNTANTAKTADAHNHNKLLRRYASDPFSPYVSYHLVCDDKRCVQNLPLDESSWNAGDGSKPGSGNRSGVAIEICENADGDYEKAEENAVKVVRYLMDKLNIEHENVLPHQHFSGKHCPRKILDRKGGWEEFHQNILNTSTKTPSKHSSIELDTYTVQDGDTLWDISQKFNTTVNKIKKDNGLEDDTIFPGEKLLVKSPKTEKKKEKSKNEEQKNQYAGKRVEAKVGVRFYSRPSWDDKDVVGIAKEGFGFEIIEKQKVGSGHQFKVKNSKGNVYYLTANTKYVKII